MFRWKVKIINSQVLEKKKIFLFREKGFWRNAKPIFVSGKRFLKKRETHFCFGKKVFEEARNPFLFREKGFWRSAKPSDVKWFVNFVNAIWMLRYRRSFFIKRICANSVTITIAWYMSINKCRKRIQSCDSPSIYLGTCSLMLILYVNANWQNVKSTEKHEKT